MDAEQLRRFVADQRETILPFVGSGLTLAAGAPSSAQLAVELARRADVDVDATGLRLDKVVRLAEDQLDRPAVQQHVANVITGLRLRPTPALTAISGTHLRKVLTTNDDDGIERAAITRGLTPIPLLPQDARTVATPGENELHVIHLHGVPGQPESLVLPGPTTHALSDDSVFAAFVGAAMAPVSVLYLGFNLAFNEQHLHEIISWLNRKVSGAGRQYLLLAADEIAARVDEMERIKSYRSVEVVPYAKNADHSAVERVALSLAPRVGPASRSGGSVKWVKPVLLRVGAEDDEERLRQRASSFDLGFGEDNEVCVPAALPR